MRVIFFFDHFICSERYAQEEAIFDQLSDYEKGHILRVMHKRGWQLEPEPDGKKIAFMEVYRYPVFVELKRFLFPNRLHVPSQKTFIQREILQKKGDAFSRVDLAESVRNLRRLGVFNLVAAVPIKVEQQNQVGILIVTRDLWSLRLERFSDYGHSDRSASAQLTERNLWARYPGVGSI